MVIAGLEPATLALLARCSNQLSYTTVPLDRKRREVFQFNAIKFETQRNNHS
jgi:hypothetical protein